MATTYERLTRTSPRRHTTVHSEDCRRTSPVRATPSAVLKALDQRRCLRCRILARMLTITGS